MEIDKYQNLLNKINAITSKYHNEAKETGERFNIFQILGMDSKENKTHSAFLYALLNPNGNHLQGSIFLELFLKEIGCENLIDIYTASIVVEKHIGFVDKDYQTGGRIDLVIEDIKGCAILIENKIYAYDQPNQLQRYYEYGSRRNSPFKVVYLTLDGSIPTLTTTGNLNQEKVEQIISTSYKKNIIQWLDKCAIEIGNIPFLKESIIQYKNLIHIITQTTNQIIMEQELASLLSQKEENFIAALKIQETIRNIYSSISRKVENTFAVYNSQFGKKIKYKDNYIEFSVKYDNKDGYFISFRIVDINNQFVDSLNDEYKSLFNILFNLNKSFNHNSQYLGYVNHRSISFFEHLQPQTILKLDNDVYRNKFIEDIFKEGSEYCNALEEHIKQTL